MVSRTARVAIAGSTNSEVSSEPYLIRIAFAGACYPIVSREGAWLSVDANANNEEKREKQKWTRLQESPHLVSFLTN